MPDINEEVVISKGITFPQHAPFNASMPTNSYPTYVKEQYYTPSSFGLVSGGFNLKSKKKKQIYNILNITDLIDYAELIQKETGRRIDISFLLNNYPKCLDIRNLPQNIRDVAIEKLETWSATSTYFAEDERNKQTVLGLIKALKENYNEDSKEQMQIFKEYTQLLDSKRDQSLKESLPELWELLKWT